MKYFFLASEKDRKQKKWEKTYKDHKKQQQNSNTDSFSLPKSNAKNVPPMHRWNGILPPSPPVPVPPCVGQQLPGAPSAPLPSGSHQCPSACLHPDPHPETDSEKV